MFIAIVDPYDRKPGINRIFAVYVRLQNNSAWPMIGTRQFVMTSTLYITFCPILIFSHYADNTVIFKIIILVGSDNKPTL